MIACSFKIHQDALELTDIARPTLTALRRIEWGLDGDTHYRTGPLDEVRAAPLRELLSKIPAELWTEVDLSDDYDVGKTRASKAYDYEYCVDIGAVDALGWRVVAIPKALAQYQINRYFSGLGGFQAMTRAEVEALSEQKRAA